MDLFRIAPTKDERNASIFSVLAKRSYRIVPGQALERLKAARPFIEVDQYWDDGDPTWSTVKLENDLAPYKLATDVVVVGKACSPRMQPVTHLDVTAQVGRFSKTVRVIGNRHCLHRPGQPPVFTEPLPFTDMELRYDRAYGGKDDKSLPGIEFYYPRNTMGTGLAIKNLKEVVDGLVLPNFEDPDDLLSPQRLLLQEPDRWNGQPLPQGFGWFQKVWYPRCSFVGSMPGYVDVDEVMREETLRWVPQRQIALARQFKLPAFDVRFNNGASWGLILPFLTGNEPIRLQGFTPEGSLEFELPGEIPQLSLDIGEGPRALRAVLHTVCIRLEQKEVDLIWRGSLEYPGIDWLPEMKRLHAEVH
jgi:hypothetical protein